MKLRNLFFALVVTTGLATGAVRAEEDGGGHYMPGATASFADALPGKPGFAAIDMFTFYNGGVGGSTSLNFGGDVALGAHATAYANTIGLVYESNLKLLDGNYAAALAIPFIQMEVDAQSVISGPGPRRSLLLPNVRSTTSGLGDMTIYPFMLGWTALDGDLKYDLRLGIYAPTGSYEKNRLANTGRNYWTFEPGVSASWLSSKIGTEISLFMGMDFNTMNNATDYQTGTQFHLDATIAQHLPLFGGYIGAGANVFYYQQIEGDSGAGAKMGSFEGQTAGIGPVVSYIRKVNTSDLFLEVKWLPELEVQNRTQGDYVWVKAGILF